MLRKFLTEDEKAEVEENCRRYSEWRRSLAEEVREEVEEEVTSDSQTNLNAGQDAIRGSETEAKTASPAATGKIKKRRKVGGLKVPEVPETPIIEETPSVLSARRSTFQEQSKRPVSFRPSAIAGHQESIEKRMNKSAFDEAPPAAPRLSSASRFSGRSSRRTPKILSVDEIFAKGIREWREQLDKSGRSSFVNGKHQSIVIEKDPSGVSIKGKHVVRKEIETENEERKRKYDLEKSVTAIEARESSMLYSSDEDFEETETETEESSTMTDEQIHRKKVQHHLDIAADILKLIVIFFLGFGLTILPVTFLESDNRPRPVKLSLTEKNICYWDGSKGFLDETNPCPYRGYIANDKDGHECLRWKDAIEGGNGLNGVGLDNIDYGKHLFVKEYLGLWKKLYHARDTASMTPERRDLITDYEHRFCRRMGNDPQNNQAVCLTLGENGEAEMDNIHVGQCWIVPCSIKVASQCYQQQVQAEDQRSTKT